MRQNRWAHVMNGNFFVKDSWGGDPRLRREGGRMLLNTPQKSSTLSNVATFFRFELQSLAPSLFTAVARRGACPSVQGPGLQHVVPRPQAQNYHGAKIPCRCRACRVSYSHTTHRKCGYTHDYRTTEPTGSAAGASRHRPQPRLPPPLCCRLLRPFLSTMSQWRKKCCFCSILSEMLRSEFDGFHKPCLALVLCLLSSSPIPVSSTKKHVGF